MIFNPVLDPALAAHHSRFGFLKKWNLALLAFLKPLGIWGIGGLAIVDSAAIPVPLDALVLDYVAHDHARAVLYCLMAALGSAIGSLLPYAIGRAGGELFLLKRINRERYEKLRDRFEKQEFLAIMLPAMAPPPFPVKLFELAAGVFEMRPAWYFSAIFVGKFVRFLAVSVIIIFFGQRILHSVMGTLHYHLGLALSGCGVLLLLLALYVTRKLFDKRRGTEFPAEAEEDGGVRFWRLLLCRAVAKAGTGTGRVVLREQAVRVMPGEGCCPGRRGGFLRCWRRGQGGRRGRLL